MCKISGHMFYKTYTTYVILVISKLDNTKVTTVTIFMNHQRGEESILTNFLHLFAPRRQNTRSLSLIPSVICNRELDHSYSFKSYQHLLQDRFLSHDHAGWGIKTNYGTITKLVRPWVIRNLKKM